MRYIIKSKERDEGRNYFVAIHSFTPFYSDKDKAQPFLTEQAAVDYALAELFTNRDAFEVVAVSDNQQAMNIKPGQTVIRIASDYTNGRKGKVIELDNMRPRARVEWQITKHGKPALLRTWVRLSDLRPESL
jgi:hypothetical protein